MGNITIDMRLFPLTTGQWKMSPRNPRLLVEKKTGTVAECNIVYINNKEIIQNYQFRSLHKQYLVGVLAILKEGAEVFCFTGTSTSQCFLHRDKVLLAIEYIPYRLTDLGTLTYAEGVYTLFQCLHGLKIIMEKYGRVFRNFEEEMIGVNLKGQCKIWVNTDYFKGVEEENQGLTEGDLIQILFSRIQDRMSAQMDLEVLGDYNNLKNSYFNKVTDKNNRINFNKALKFVETLSRINLFNMDEVRLKNFSTLTANKQLECLINSSKRKTSLKAQNKIKPSDKKNLSQNIVKCQYLRKNTSTENSSQLSLSKRKYGYFCQQLQVECPQKQSRCTMQSERLANSYINLYKKSSQPKKTLINKIKF